MAHTGMRERAAGRRRATSVAVALQWAVAAAFVAVSLTLVPYTPDEVTMVGVVTLVALVPFVLGTLVAVRRPGHAAGPLLVCAGLMLVLTNVPGDHTPDALAGGWMLLYLPFALLMIVLPDGRAASRFWRAIGRALIAVVGAFIVLCALQALWPAAEQPLTAASLVVLAAFMVLLIACAAAPIVRYRRSDDDGRLRLRWVYLAGATLPATLLLCWTSYLVLGGPELVGVGLLLMFLGIPLGVSVALLRPTLVDIDRVAVAVATAGGLVVAVCGVLSIAGAAVGVPLVDWSPVAATATTAGLTLAAVGAFPFAHRGLDRLLYPERARGVQALRRLSRQVDAGGAAPEEITTVLRAALHDPGFVAAYRRLADGQLVSLDGAPAPLERPRTPIRVRGEEIGALIASADRVKRPPAAVARAAAPLLDAARSRAELARATAEVEASRERLLRAGYEERRRLERDLHDGAQQRLVALGMRLRVLQRAPTTTAADSDALEVAVAELGTAVAELRRIAQGVRPSALDDGLAAALADLARLAPGSIELDVPPLELPDAVATTAYFVVSEAVANALRHAQATRITIRVVRDAAWLRLHIADDGSGGATPRPSGGLTGLADRVAAIGGHLHVDSPAGAGTSLEAVLPCAS